MGSLFASFLGYNPIQQLIPASVLAHLPAGHAAYLTGRSFFPSLVSPAFKTGLHYAFDFAIACSLVAAVASLLRGGRYVHGEEQPEDERILEAVEGERERPRRPHVEVAQGV